MTGNYDQKLVPLWILIQRGAVFGFTMSAGYLGVFGGSVLGGQVAAYLGIKYVFFVTSTLLLLNALWVYFKMYKNLRLTENAPDGYGKRTKLLA